MTTLPYFLFVGAVYLLLGAKIISRVWEAVMTPAPYEKRPARRIRYRVVRKKRRR